MIIIQPQNEDEERNILTAVEKALRGVDADIYASDEGGSIEEIAAYIAYNTKQQRIYTGRLERNSRRMQEELTGLNRLFEPVSAFFAELMEQEVPKSSLSLDDMKRIRKKLVEEGKVEDES